MTDRELAATILILGAELKDLKGKEAKELLTQVEQEITKHVESKLKNGVLHSVSKSYSEKDIDMAYDRGYSDGQDTRAI